MTFGITLTNVLLTLVFILPGYAMGKWGKLKVDHQSTLSGLLVYLCSPCLIVASWVDLDFNIVELGYMWLFFVVTLILQIAFMSILYLLICRKHKDSKYRIFTIASVMGNVGFFGKPMVQALLPNNPEALVYSSMFTLSLNFLVFSVGIFCLTGKKEYMTLKSAICTPNMAGVLIGMPLYIIGAKFFVPTALMDAVWLLGNMTTPLCMIILGVRLSSVCLKKLFMRPLIYGLCVSKMMLFPLFNYAVIYFLPLPTVFKSAVLILSAVPCAAVILNMAELHHSETEMAANCVLVTTLLSFITMPIMMLLL